MTEKERIEAMVRARIERELETDDIYLDNESRLLGKTQNIHQIAAMIRKQKEQFKKSA